MEIKAQRMYEMVILTSAFGEFEFTRTFSLLLLPDKNCGKNQFEIPKMLKIREIEIAKISKSAGKFKIPKSCR